MRLVILRPIQQILPLVVLESVPAMRIGEVEYLNLLRRLWRSSLCLDFRLPLPISTRLVDQMARLYKIIGLFLFTRCFQRRRDEKSRVVGCCDLRFDMHRRSRDAQVTMNLGAGVTPAAEG